MANELIIEPNTRWTMEYEDSRGTLTRREVTFKNFQDKDGTIYANAYCHSRQAPRSFRADRIKSFISEDGEVLDIAFMEPATPPQNAHRNADRNSHPVQRPARKSGGFRRWFLPFWYVCAAFLALAANAGENPVGLVGATMVFILFAAPIFMIDLLVGMVTKRIGTSKQ